MDKKIVNTIMEDMDLENVTISEAIKRIDEKIASLDKIKTFLGDLKQKKWEELGDIIKKEFQGYEFYQNITDNAIGIYVPINEKLNLRCFISFTPHPHYGIRKEGDDSVSPKDVEDFLNSHLDLIQNKCESDYFWNYVEEACEREENYKKFREYCKKLISHIEKRS